MDYSGLSRVCKNRARVLDYFCHDVKNGGEENFLDYRDESGLCSQEHAIEEFHCLAQQCAFDYCLGYRDTYIEDCEESIPAFEEQWDEAVQEVGCRRGRGDRCWRLNEAVAFVNLDDEEETFERYSRAKKHFRLSSPDYEEIYDFDNFGDFESTACDAFNEIYEDADENPEDYEDLIEAWE